MKEKKKSERTGRKAVPKKKPSVKKKKAAEKKPAAKKRKTAVKKAPAAKKLAAGRPGSQKAPRRTAGNAPSNVRRAPLLNAATDLVRKSPEELDRMYPEGFRVLSPTGILGYGFPPESFARGIERKPHLIAVDGGSTDPGPYYLGKGKSFTDRAFVKRDLRFMITEGVKRKIPVVIGTAGGSGARPHLSWCKDIIEEIAREEKLEFTLGVIPADIPHSLVLKALERGWIEPLKFAPPVTAEDVARTPHIVAQFGVEPIIEAHRAGCDVILCGRCYDPAVFAALPILLGFDPALATHMGKIIECAAIAATPGSGADCVLGILKGSSFILEALNDRRRFTRESTAAHTLYEKSDPYHLPGPGGTINLEGCSFTELDGGRVEVRGSRFEPAIPYRIKLEGSRLTGYRTVSIAGTHDPVMIASVDSVLEQVRLQTVSWMERENIRGKIHFHVYGKNGVMGPLEPGAPPAHELGIVIDAVGASQAEADTVCSLTRSTLLHYGYEGRISTAGNLAFPFSPSDIPMGEVYEFSLFHLMDIDSQGLFPLGVETCPPKKPGRAGKKTPAAGGRRTKETKK